VLQFGPSRGPRDDANSVLPLISDYLPSHVSLLHIPTMKDGSALANAALFTRALGELQRALESAEQTVVHVQFAARGSTLRQLILAEMTVRAGRPLVVQAQDPEFRTFHRRLPGAVRRNVDRTLQRASMFIVMSSAWRDFHVQECGIAPTNVVVMPTPVRVPRQVPDRDARDQVQFLHVGAPDERHGGREVLQAFAGLPQGLRKLSNLVLAGDVDLEELRALAAPHGDRVSVRRSVDLAERARLYAASDVFVLPSRADGAAMFLLEAMAHALPSIASPGGTLAEYFRDGVDGMLVAPGNVHQIRAAMASMIIDGAGRVSRGHHARDRACAFDVHAHARQLADIYLHSASVADLRAIA